MPYENYRKAFRTSQKYIERELSAVTSASNELTSKAATNPDDTELLKTLDAMIAKVEGLGKKVGS